MYLDSGQRSYSSEACCVLSSRLLASVLYTALRHSPSPPARSVGKDGCCFAERVVSCCTVTSQALWAGWAQEDFRLEEPHLGFTPWQAKWAFCTTVWCGTCCISSVDLNRNINFWNGLISKNEPNTDSLSKHILFHHRRCKWIMCGLLKSKFKFRTEFTIAAIYSSTGTKWPISQDRKLIWFIFSKNYIKSSFLHWPFLDFK